MLLLLRIPEAEFCFDEFVTVKEHWKTVTCQKARFLDLYCKVYYSFTSKYRLDKLLTSISLLGLVSLFHCTKPSHKEENKIKMPQFNRDTHKDDNVIQKIELLLYRIHELCMLKMKMAEIRKQLRFIIRNVD